MASTHQFACISAFPCGDGQLQQVDVQDAHIICVTNRHVVVSISVQTNINTHISFPGPNIDVNSKPLGVFVPDEEV